LWAPDPVYLPRISQLGAAHRKESGWPLLGTKWNECPERSSSCIDLHPDGLLDLQTRDLAETKTVSGIIVVFDPGKISMVYTLPRSLGSSHSRTGSITNILGLSGGPQEVGETADGLLERLNLTVLHIADITGRDSRMGEGFFGNIFSGYRALGPHSSRSENRRERRRPGDLREGKRDNHQIRYQCDPVSKQVPMKARRRGPADRHDWDATTG
jgi:hypothetical protein